MILRLLLFASILMLFCINNIYGALNVAKLNLNPQQQQQQQNGDSKQHRHSMDQLEPDLAQTIFGGIQRNPLERTTTAKPKAIAIIKSPTLRGKRDTLPEIKLADVKHLGNDDPLPEQLPKKESDYENINADSKENSKSEAVEATTTVDLIFDERINLSDESENKNETIIDSELAVITSGPLEESAATTLSATVSKTQGMVVQEVAAPTPKYNLTQNDNSPTENLDRKILAFEINSHNRKVFEELQKKKSAAIAAKILENPESNFEEAETSVFSTTTITPAPAANEVQIDESKKLLNEVSFNGSPKTLTTSLPSIIQEATKEEVENAPENPATSESKAQESIQTPEQPNEQSENANERIPTLTSSIPVEAEAGVIESEVNVKNAESPTEGDVQFSKATSQESLPEVPDHLKHQTEVPAATPITEAAGSHSKEEFTTPQTSFPEGDFILPENSESLHQAELLAEANAAKVGSLQFPSQLPSIFYEKASQKKKVSKISQQQPPPPPHQETQPPPPPPPTDAQIQGFLLPHRPILDSSVQKRRHLISNYIDPIQQQKSSQFQQKQEFFRKSAVIARERSKRETKPEQTTVTYEDDVIDEVDSGESNIIVRLTTNAEEDNPTTTTADKNVEDITATTAGVESSTSLPREHQLKLVSKKNGTKKDVLDNEVQKSTVILENEEHATTAITSAESKTSESIDSTIESTKPSEATTTTDEPTIPSKATTARPIKKPKISKALTREEKLALLESQSPRTGINLGKIHLPKKSSAEAIDASAEPQDPENPWTHRFKSHIQLKLTDESREVVERTELKVLPKLISPEVLKAQKKAEREAKKKAKKEAEEEELEFKDLPEPRSGDIKVDVDVVTKPATKSATLLTTTVNPTTTRSRVPQQLQQQIPQNFFVRPQQQFQQQPQQQFFQSQQQQQPFFQSQQQQIFPQQRTQFPQHRIISIDGVRYILRDPAPQQQFFQPPPQQFFQPQQFQQQQQQFLQRPPPPSLRAPPSHSPPTTQQPSKNSTPKIKPHRIIHSGNAKQFSTTPAPTTPTLGPRVNPEDLSVVRIFQHRGTTKQIFATTPAPTTRPPSTTPFITESTTQWIPVTFTTHPTPTTPFDIFLVTTAAPIPNSRVKTHRDLFEVYDEVDFSSDPTTTTSKPKKIKKPLPQSRTPPSTKRHDPSDFDLISEVTQEQSFRDIPLRHPPHDPPSTNFEDYFDDQQRKSLRRKQPKLVRLNNSNSGVSQKAADFIGDVPIAKSDLRGLDKTIALNS
uniref:Uncharacterized protein n=1 Tax=Panagrolaimus sp. PS1159 TaxID=55785 RepID=A0AC35FN98_9BILA